MSVILGITLILIFFAYTWWLRPYFTEFDMGKISFEAAETQTKGFPFKTEINITEPRIFYNGQPFWVGEEMRLEWSLYNPTRMTLHLDGQHIISASPTVNMRASVHLSDTKGYIHLNSLQSMQIDMKGQNINVRLPARPGQNTGLLSAQKLYVFYDGPTTIMSQDNAGDLHVSAEFVDIPPYMKPPFNEPIERLDFKAVYNEQKNHHDINNIVFFWDALRAAGNGKLKYGDRDNEGDFLMAVQGLEALIGGMYKSGRFGPKQVRDTVHQVTMVRVQQNRNKEDPIYLPVSYSNRTIMVAGIPFYTINKTNNAEAELQRLITEGLPHGQYP